MFQSRIAPFEDDVEKATNENNLTEDWSLIMHICDNAVNYQDGSKFCFKAIMKRMHHPVPRVVMQTLTLLDSCVKNCDRRFLLQVASSEFTTEVGKLLGKMHPSCATKLKELLQKWSLEEFKDDPELCIIPSLFYKLKSEGVEFPSLESEKKTVAPVCSDPNAVTSQEEENDIIKALEMSLKDTGRYSTPTVKTNTDVNSILPEKSLRDPFKVIALYEFEACEENELSLLPGDVVLVTNNSDQNWWEGSTQKDKGLFPANFVSEEEFLKSQEPTVAASDSGKEVDTSDDFVSIDEEKIDKVINWLNDVDPTEELSDPEDMLKLERECSKMTPLIEECLQGIDNRLVTLESTNAKIMAAFELFHDLSTATNPIAMTTLPFNRQPFSSAIQNRYAHHTLPHSVTNSGSIPSPASQNNPPTLSNISSAAIVKSQLDMQPSNSLQNQTVNHSIPILESTAKNTDLSANSKATVAASANLSMNTVLPPVRVVGPYATNVGGGFFLPPGTFPLPPNPQQGYLPFPGLAQPYMGMPYSVPPVGPQASYPYYYINNLSTQPPVAMQCNISCDPSNSQPQTVTLNTSTSVSNVLSSTPVPSVSSASYYNDFQQMASVDTTAVLTPMNSKQEALETPSSQASGDQQTTNNHSSSESS